MSIAELSPRLNSSTAALIRRLFALQCTKV